MPAKLVPTAEGGESLEAGCNWRVHFFMKRRSANGLRAQERLTTPEKLPSGVPNSLRVPETAPETTSQQTPRHTCFRGRQDTPKKRETWPNSTFFECIPLGMFSPPDWRRDLAERPLRNTLHSFQAATLVR